MEDQRLIILTKTQHERLIALALKDWNWQKKRKNKVAAVVALAESCFNALTDFAEHKRT